MHHSNQPLNFHYQWARLLVELCQILRLCGCSVSQVSVWESELTSLLRKALQNAPLVLRTFSWFSNLFLSLSLSVLFFLCGCMYYMYVFLFIFNLSAEGLAEWMLSLSDSQLLSLSATDYQTPFAVPSPLLPFNSL